MERVSQIVDAGILELGTGTNALPAGLQIEEAGTRKLSGDDHKDCLNGSLWQTRAISVAATRT